MSAKPRFFWPRIRPGAPLSEIIALLNSRLPLVQPSIEEAAKGAVSDNVIRAVRVITEIIAHTDTTVTVRASAVAPDASSADPCHDEALPDLGVTLTGLTNSTIVSGTALNTKAPNPSVWELARPAAGAGPGQAIFEGSVFDPAVTGFQPDEDQLVIPEQGNDIPFVSGILLTVELVASDNFTATIDVRAEGTGETPPTSGIIAITNWQNLDPADQTPTSGALTGALPLVARFVLSRPLFATGQGQAAFSAIASDIPGALPDADSVDIPEIQQDTIAVDVRVQLVSETESTTTVDVVASDPRDAVVPTIAVLAYTGVAAPTLGATSVVGTTRTTRYTIARPAVGGGSGLVTWKASAAGRVDDTDSLVVTEKGASVVRVLLKARQVAQSATTVSIVLDVSDPVGGAAPSYEVSSSQGIGGAITGVGTTVNPYVIPRPAYGTGNGRVVFRAFKTGRVEDYDAVDVPEIQRDTVTMNIVVQASAPGATALDVSVTAADPLGLVAATIAVEDAGGLTVTNLGGGIWRIARPAVGSAPGRVVFRASGTGRVTGYDSVDVPAVDPTQFLTCKAELVSSTATTATVRVTASDPRGAINPTITPTWTNTGAVTVSSNTASGGTRVTTYLVTLQTLNANPSAGDFVASATGRISANDRVDLPAYRYTGGGDFEINQELILDAPAGSIVTAGGYYGVGWLGYPAPYGGPLPAGTIFEVQSSVEFPVTTGAGNQYRTDEFVASGRIVTPPDYQSTAIDVGCIIADNGSEPFVTAAVMTVEVWAYFQGTMIAYRRLVRKLWAKKLGV